VDTTDLTYPPYPRATRSCGLAVLGVGAAALVGWAAKQPVLLGLRSSYIPMAPNTALAFVVMGLGLMAVAGGGRRARGLASAGAVLVALIGALRLIELATGLDIAVDRWFYRAPAARFGLAEVGKMSPYTAAAFVAAGTGLAALAGPFRRERAGNLAGPCGLIAGLTGLVFGLGYLFSPNAPLLYGTQSIPMALNTSLCFVGLGAGLVAAAGPRAFPLRRLAGPSVRARLLRVFLPLVVGTVGVVAWLTHVVTGSAGASSAAISSAALAVAAIFLFALICERIARRVGEQLERAESELRQAHDELEVKVEERTADLSRANAELGRSLRETRAAHEALQIAHRELKEAQSRMIQQAKMASLGQTAAGVAHEINNPLAFVTNNLAVLKREVTGLHDLLSLYQQAEQTLAEYEHVLHAKIVELAEEVDLPFVLTNLDGLLERSRGGLRRIQKIVEGLRAFAHLEEADFQEADLNAGVRSTVDLMRTLADGRQVVLETDLAEIPHLTCYPAELNMVLQSLISNAIDASPPGGRVVVSTRPVGPGIEVEVADTGSGIPVEIRDKVFDPFFTTKPIGKGTGLGLSISYGIVKDHGGTIDFESTPGRGTRFTVRLPSNGAPRPCATH
jgi:two-component system NtrC family sensor kinase